MTLIYRTNMECRQVTLFDLETIRNTETREVTEKNFQDRLRDLHVYATQSWTAPLRKMVTTLSETPASLRTAGLNRHKWRKAKALKGDKYRKK
jgi:hypothetical protein